MVYILQIVICSMREIFPPNIFFFFPWRRFFYSLFCDHGPDFSGKWATAKREHHLHRQRERPAYRKNT